MKPISELWDNFGNYLKRSERLYQVIVSVVIAAVLVHLLLGTGLGQAGLEKLHELTSIQTSLFRLVIWALMTWLVTVLLIRGFQRISHRLRSEEPMATVIRKGDLTLTETSAISDIPRYSETLTDICSQQGLDAVHFVNELLSIGISLNASDLYLSPKHHAVGVTMRVHGQLYDLTDLPTEAYSQVINRIKVLCNLPSYIRNSPQDGHISFEDNKHTARVSILPTSHGERTAIRLPLGGSRILDLDHLGMPDQMLEDYRALLNRNQGMIILTGPTGSGKTTTMFASLLDIHHTRGESVNIVTLEDPIETDFEFFHQTQIDSLTNMTFATGLRSVLRQDPDVIMLGEIRDEETAVNAMRAAMTGHLLLTTVHASGTTGVFDRLMQMGIGSSQLSSTIHAVISQRLCHCLCQDCRQESPLGESHRRQLMLMGMEEIPEGPFYIATGCDSCLGKGYTDRMPLFEMLMITDPMRDMIASDKPSHHIYREARDAGMHNLFDHGLSLAKEGRVSLLEVIRMASS